MVLRPARPTPGRRGQLADAQRGEVRSAWSNAWSSRLSPYQSALGSGNEVTLAGSARVKPGHSTDTPAEQSAAAGDDEAAAVEGEHQAGTLPVCTRARCSPSASVGASISHSPHEHQHL